MNYNTDITEYAYKKDGTVFIKSILNRRFGKEFNCNHVESLTFIDTDNN
ncbi:MAG: hypothetical protein AABX16_04330 [Nanoarchaeota archaeon]